MGGTSTPWGITKVPDVIAAKPDLVLLAFGMNDSSGRPAAEYAANMSAMIQDIRKVAPETEFILVAGMLGNADWVALKQELFPAYRDALQELTGPGIVLADLTSLWTELLKRKPDSNLTGNGVNHPNDFGHRIYAQVLTTLLLPRETPAPAPANPIEVLLWPDEAPNGDQTFEKSTAKITVHIADKPSGAAMVICPGGGYGGLVTGPEGHGIAKWLNTHGITGIVLEYRLPRGRAFVPLLDAQQAIRITRMQRPGGYSRIALGSWAFRQVGIWLRPPPLTSSRPTRRPLIRSTITRLAPILRSSSTPWSAWAPQPMAARRKICSAKTPLRNL